MIIRDSRDILLLKYNELVALECKLCHIIFKVKQKYVKHELTHKNNFLQYCSRKCQHEAARTSKIHMCKQCGTEIVRKPSETKNKSGNVFCSQPCAARYNNSHHSANRKFGPAATMKKCKYCGAIVGTVKRTCILCKEKMYKEKYMSGKSSIKSNCATCGIEIYGRRKFCFDHHPRIDGNKTIAELEAINGNPSNKHMRIRDHAKGVANKYGIRDTCELCGYSKAVEVCHIKGIASFDKSAKICEVNGIKNLICLCPNHHWEFDHNLLSDEDALIINRIIANRDVEKTNGPPDPDTLHAPSDQEAVALQAILFGYGYDFNV